MNATAVPPVREAFSRRDDPLRRLLRRVRRRLRTLALLEGVATVLCGLAAAVGVGFALDWSIEPSRPVRIMGLLAAAVGGGVLVGRYVLWRLAARLPKTSLALLVERHDPALAGRLLTALQLTGAEHAFDDDLVRRTHRQAAERLADFDPAHLTRLRPVVLRWLTAAALAAALVGFALARPVLAAVWLDRTVGLKDVLYPRATTLAMLGWDGPVRKVAQGRPVELLVRAGGAIPETVTLTSAGSTQTMTQVGEDRFRLTLANLVEPLDLTVSGGDADLTGLRLLPVAAPALAAVELVADFPDYTGLPDRTVPAGGGAVTLPRGSAAVLRLAANKPLADLTVTRSAGVAGLAADGETVEDVDADRPAEALRLPVRLAGDGGEVPLAIDGDMLLTIDLTDADGIRLAEPFALRIAAAADRPPTVRTALRGISDAVTRSATVPVEIDAADEFGIADLAFEANVAVEGQPPAPTRLPIPLPAGARRFGDVARFDVVPLDLSPGAELTLATVAADGDTLAGPNVGRGETFRVEVVTPEELLARIATRELYLRQQFERIVAELKTGRGALDTLRGELAGDDRQAAGRRRLHLGQAVQVTRKNANEIGGLAGSFTDILLELDNNRVGNSEMRARLEQGIVLPLEGLVAGEFPALDDVLAAMLADPDALAGKLATAEARYDPILARCEQVLAAMRKLESFNEAVAMLRSLRDEQLETLQATKGRRKRQVLDLLK